MKYLLIEHDILGEGNVKLTICDTREQREQATLAALFDKPESEGKGEEAKDYLRRLQRDYALQFPHAANRHFPTFDPWISWVNADEVITREGPAHV